MAKKQIKKESHDASIKYDDPRMAFMSTKTDMVVQETDFTLNDILENGDNSKAVIAEDQNGLYVTAHSLVGSNLLDGYRMYKRDLVKVTKEDDKFVISNKYVTFTV